MWVLAADHVIPMKGPILSPGYVVIDGKDLVDVCEGRPSSTAPVILGGAGSVLIPGLIAAHAHLALGEFRHVADDRSFFDWLLKGLLPALERGHADPSIFRRGAERSVAELLTSGTTFVADSFFRAEGVQACQAQGLKGIFFQEVFGSLAPDEDEALRALGPELDRLPEALLGFAFGYAPHTPWTCPRKTLLAVTQRAREENRLISIHVDESQEERAFFRDNTGPLAEMIARRGTSSRYVFGASPTRYLESLGVLGPRTLAVHAVQVDDDDIEILARTRTPVVHCPISNAKLGEGIAPIPRMLQKGVTVALGVDSVASSGRLDLLSEMRTSLLMHRAANRSAAAISSKDVLEMATMGGAKALGMDDRIGSLEKGKAADLVLLRLDRVRHGPISDPISSVVETATPEDVAYVIIDGQVRHSRDRGS